MTIFIAGALLNRRRERMERRRAALSELVAPPVEHPLLGLGGRSIELSRAQGVPISPDAVALASDALHDVVKRMLASRADVPVDELKAARSSASFLADAASEVRLSRTIRAVITSDIDSLAHLG